MPLQMGVEDFDPLLRAGPGSPDRPIVHTERNRISAPI
jgi:hypothetical protein